MSKEFKPKKIIWLDDELFIVKPSRLFLERDYGHHIDLYTNVNDFIDALFLNDYDFVILDIMMLVEDFNNNSYLTFTHIDYHDMDQGMNTGCVLAKKISMYNKKDKFGRDFKKLPILFYSAKSISQTNNYIKDYCENFYTIRKPQLASEIDRAICKLYKKYIFTSYRENLDKSYVDIMSLIDVINVELDKCGNISNNNLIQLINHAKDELKNIEKINNEFNEFIKTNKYYNDLISDIEEYKGTISEIKQKLSEIEKQIPEFTAEVMNVEDTMFKDKS